ncbi:MAG: lipoprotein-releasing ABC transporter permease subunit [Alphaproteobacteria bacterium]|nr:lipoprotein-releasing ABC transporter permease subunit [Alphaproteobacteria bacterium]
MKIFTPVERMLAMRYMRSRRSEGFISVIAWFSLLGIALGVATLIIVMSVMNGFRVELVGRILGLNGHLAVYSSSGRGITDFDPLSVRIAGIPGVVAVTPQVEGQVMAASNGLTTGAVVRGVRWADLAARKPLWSALDETAIQNFKTGKQVLMGHRLAQTIGVGPGDSITLVGARGRSTPFGTLPQRRTFKVGGVFDVGMFEYDKSFIFMPLDAAQSFFGSDDRVTALEIYASDLILTDVVRTNLTQTVPGSVRVNDWRDRNRSFLNALAVERNVMFLILTLIILVAAFNIISSMIMLVRSKNNDIAVLRAMGGTSGGVMRVFFMTGASIGVVGTVIGTLLGLGFCWNIDGIRMMIENLTGSELFAAEIYFLSTLPAEVNPREVFSVILMALTLSFAASIYPAWRASRIAPAEALRYE